MTRSICVAGDFYCHHIEGNCTSLPQTTAGASCSYDDRPIPLGELTIITDDDDDDDDDDGDEEEDSNNNEECKIW